MNPNDYRSIGEDAFPRPQPMLRDGVILGPVGEEILT